MGKLIKAGLRTYYSLSVSERKLTKRRNLGSQKKFFSTKRRNLDSQKKFFSTNSAIFISPFVLKNLFPHCISAEGVPALPPTVPTFLPSLQRLIYDHVHWHSNLFGQMLKWAPYSLNRMIIKMIPDRSLEVAVCDSLLISFHKSHNLQISYFYNAIQVKSYWAFNSMFF